MRGYVQGVNPGNAPSNTMISGRPDNSDLPGHFPFAIGPAAAGEGGGDPGGREDDQRDGQSTAPSTDMIVAIHFDET
eukprot:7814724-Pyramimonas_sp.AAC.1